jgi:hypothetical protein
MDLTTPSSSPTISKRCSEVKNLLEGLLAAVSKEPRDGFSITKDDISNQLDRFLLWAGNLGALRSPKSKLSLDQRLSSAPEVREQILRQFADIEEAVDDRESVPAVLFVVVSDNVPKYAPSCLVNVQTGR